MDNISSEASYASGKKFIFRLLGFSMVTWVSFVLSFFSTPIVTRLFSPEEVGKINLFNTYLNLFLLIAYLGIDQSYVRFFNESLGQNDKKGLWIVCVLITEIFACFFIIGLFIFGETVSTWITGSTSTVIIICLAIALLANILLRFLSLSSRMEINVKLYSFQAIALVVVNKLIFIVVAFWNPSHIYAIICMTCGFLVLSIVCFKIQFKTIFTKKVDVSKNVIKELLRFGLPLVPVTMLSWLNNSLAQLLMRNFLSFSAIGIYSNAVSIANLITLIQSGFNAYWVPYVFANYKEGQEQIKKVHLIITFIMVFFGLSIILCQDIIYLLIGEGFRSGKIFFPFLLISPICYTIAETTGVGIGIAKKTYLNIITFVISTGVNILIAFILLPIIGISGAAVAAGLSAVVMLIVKTILGEKYYRCISRYSKTFSAVVIFVLAVLINYYLFELMVIKYVLIIILLLILILIYWSETKYLFGFGRMIFKSVYTKIFKGEKE